MLRHLRQNTVAYLALLVALGTGGAYAADQIANGSVTAKKLAKNSVTSAKIKKNAVRSADIKNGTVGSVDIKDGSVTATDLAPGLLPGGSTLASGVIGGADDPPANPDTPEVDPFEFVLAAAGDVYVRYSAGRFGLTCTSGDPPRVGLSFDGVPVPDTSLSVPTSPNAYAFAVATVVPAAAGGHKVAINVECAVGTWNVSTRVNVNWTVIGVPANG